MKTRAGRGKKRIRVCFRWDEMIVPKKNELKNFNRIIRIRLFGDLPDVAARVGKAGSADAPRSIHGAIQQLYTASG